MKAGQWNKWSREQASRNVRVTLLSLILVFIGIQTTESGSSGIHIAINALLCAVYIANLWLPARLVPGDRQRAAIVVSLWIATAVPWIAFQSLGVSLSLIFFLMAYNALRVSFPLSAYLGAIIIVLDALIMHQAGEIRGFIWSYSVFHAAIYIFVWGDRMRRQAVEASRRHYRELGEAHARLEQAHRELRQAHEELEGTHEELARAHEELELAHEELEEAADRSLRFAVLEERARIARDIHDSIGHGLTSVIVQLQAMPYMLKTNPAEADRTLVTVLDVARRCLTDVRGVVRQMAAEDAQPAGAAGLKKLIAQVRSHSNLAIALDVSGSSGLWSADISELLYRVLQEALTNVIRHSGATSVEIAIDEDAAEWTMTVTDNGSYTGEPPLVPGFGLSGMKARCEREGGSFAIRPAEPHGARITIKVPKGGGGKE